MKLIQVGIGGRGRHWLEFVAQRPDFETVACVDVDDKALAEVRDSTGCRTFASLDEALAAIDADGVIVASPSRLHGEHARTALGAGVAAMVEKPLAATLEEAVDVVHAATSAGHPVMVAENYRFFQAERTLRQLLDDGKAGRIVSVSCVDRRDQPSGTQGPWVKTMPQPFLTEIAVHHFDSFRYLFGQAPISVWARAFNPDGSDYAQNAAAQALLEMQDGIRIQYSGSFVGSRYDYELSIRGEHGELRTNRSKVWWRPSGHRNFELVEPVTLPEGEALRYPHAGMLSLLTQFRGAVREGSKPETSGDDNLWTLAMYEAAVRSADTGSYVSIDDVLTPQLRRRAGLEVPG